MAGNQLKFDLVGVDRMSSVFDDIARNMDQVVRRLERLDGKKAEVKVEEKTVERVDKLSTSTRGLSFNLDKLQAAAGAVAKGGLLAVVGAQAAASAASLVQLASAIAPAAGAIAALPGGLALAGAAMGTLKIATAGVGDAFGAALTGDAEDFATALEDLSPAAQETARAVRGLAPEFDALHASVQDAFFTGMADAITDAADALLGPFSDGMTAASTSMGELTRQLLGVVSSADGVGLVDATFATLTDTIDAAAPGLTALVAAFIDLAGVGVDAIGGLTSGLGDGLTKFADWLQTAVDTGRAMDWIQNAFTVFSQLGAILSPIFQIIKAIGSAANETGGDLLGTIGLLAQGLADFLTSAEGVDFLTGLFEGLNTIGAALQPVIVALGTALAPLLPIVGQIAAALGPGLQALITGLGAGLAALAPALVPIAEAISGIVAAIAPVLPIIGQILGAIAGALAPILAAAGEGIAKVFSAMQPAVEKLLPAVETFAGILSEIGSAVFVQLADILATLLPQLADLALLLIEQMLPVWEDMGAKIMDLLPILGDLIIKLAEALLPIIEDLLPVWLQLEASIGGAVLDAIIALLPLLVQIVENLTPIIEAVSWLAAVLLSLVTDAIDVVMDAIVDVIEFFTDWQAAVADAASAIGDWMGDVADDIGDAFDDIGDFIDDAVQWFKNLPGRILRAVGDLGRLLWNAGRDIIRGLLDGINNMVGDLKGLLSSVTSWIPDWKGPMSVDMRLLAPSGEAIMGGLMDGIAAQVPALQTQLSGVTALIAGTGASMAVASTVAPAALLAAHSSGLTIPGAREADPIDYDRLADAIVSALGPTIVQVDGREIARANRTGERRLRREGGN